MAEDGVPALADLKHAPDEEEEDYSEESVDVEDEGEGSEGDEESDEEGNNNSNQRQQQRQQEDEEAPPPLNDSSGSESGFPTPEERKAEARRSRTGTAAAASSSSSSSTLPSRNPAKPPAAAGSTPKGSAVGQPDPPLWTAFAKSREKAERLGLGPLKKWEKLERGRAIPPEQRMWYWNRVLGNRSVEKALKVPKLPSGFPEFCHWIADGNHKSCGGNLMGGFAAMAEFCVGEVKAEEAARRAAVSPPLSRQISAGSRGNFPAGGGAARGAAPAAEPAGGGGAGDPRARKRERKARKGGGVNSGARLAEMQSVIAGLVDEGMCDAGAGGGDPASGAAARASWAGVRAQAEIGERGGKDARDDDDNADAIKALGVAFADSKLHPGTLEMLANLRRARAFRRRADRQSAFLESELERCLGRFARMEAQYNALVAETRGRECTLQDALDAVPRLLKVAAGRLSSGAVEGALESYDDAVKLLEVHVDQSASRGARETDEFLRARQLLGLSLCNRSVANLSVGNGYNAKLDAVRAVGVWPTKTSKEHLEKSRAWLGPTPKASQWTPFPVPP